MKVMIEGIGEVPTVHHDSNRFCGQSEPHWTAYCTWLITSRAQLEEISLDLESQINQVKTTYIELKEVIHADDNREAEARLSGSEDEVLESDGR